MANIKTGVITISGKKYECSVNELTGERLVAGKKLDEFMNTLTFNEKLQLAMIGQKVKKKEPISLQKMMDEFYQSKNN